MSANVTTERDQQELRGGEVIGRGLGVILWGV